MLHIRQQIGALKLKKKEKILHTIFSGTSSIWHPVAIGQNFPFFYLFNRINGVFGHFDHRLLVLSWCFRSHGHGSFSHAIAGPPASIPTRSRCDTRNGGGTAQCTIYGLCATPSFQVFGICGVRVGMEGASKKKHNIFLDFYYKTESIRCISFNFSLINFFHT